ncbi:MAG TPA: extracellular solute-binding protein [Candidatus Limnocylindrales bacterium]|nr:extracellular solute-binding protein [Candidatus Limnocylindrales bacterium]
MSLLARLTLAVITLAALISLAFDYPIPVWAGAALDETQAKIEGARKEGRVILYTNASGIAPLIKRFEEKYPFLKVEQLRTGAPKLLNRILAEYKAGALKADLIETEGLTSYLMMKRGLYAKYVSPESKVLPAGAKDGDGQWTNAHSNYKIVAYNSRFVLPAELPKSYEDLTQPKWQGKILMGSNNYEWFGNMVKILGEERGMSLMRRLNAQNLMLREGNSLILQLLLAGEGFVTIAANVDSVEELKAKGAPIDWLGLEPTISRLHPIALARTAQHPNAAKLYIDFILSKEAQEIITKEFIGISDRPDVKRVFTRENLKLHYADLSLAERYDEITKKFDAAFKIR